MTAPVILDTGALIALRRRSTIMWRLLDHAQRTGLDVLVPAGVLVQAIRGGPGDALVNRVLKRPHTQVTVHDEQRARAAGELLARARTDDAIDALVAIEALRHGAAVILTSDPDDMSDLVRGYDEIDVVRV